MEEISKPTNPARFNAGRCSSQIMTLNIKSLKICIFQSLAMYVPPDEPIQDQGEINMTFQHDENAQNQKQAAAAAAAAAASSSAGASHQEGPVAAINPIYQRYLNYFTTNN